LSYNHDQFGTLVVLSLGPFAVIMSIILAFAGLSTAAGVVWLVALILLVLFYRLSVEVTREHLRFRFGIGLIGRTFSIADIAAARAVRNKWYYGWGIRKIPGGWMYNVWGLDAVELELQSGKKFRIGTDEPTELLGILSLRT